MAIHNQIERKPRISGIFNNCLLNCALPSIIDQVAAYAALPASELKALEGTYIFENYKQLKLIFATSFRLADIKKSHFTWQHFHHFIQSHNFYANELLFAPGFRAFIKAELNKYDFDAFLAALPRNALDPLGQEDTEDNSEIRREYEYLKSHVDTLMAGGTYPFLDTRYLNLLFYQPLGLNLNIHTALFRRGEATPYAYANQTPLAERAAAVGAPLDIYFKNHHYELQPHELLGEVTKTYIKERDNLNKPLKRVHETLTQENYPQKGKDALERLIAYGNTELEQILNPEAQNTANFYFHCLCALAAAGAALLVTAILIHPIISMPFAIGMAAIGAGALIMGAAGLFSTKTFGDAQDEVVINAPSALASP